MKATGIIRRMDELGRIVVPKEIRRTLALREGDPMEIYLDDDGGIVFKKYDYYGEVVDLIERTIGIIQEMAGETVVAKTLSHRVVGKLQEAVEIAEEWRNHNQ